MGLDRTVTVVQAMTDAGPMTVRDDRGVTYHLVAYGSEFVREALAGRRVGDRVRLRMHPAGSRADTCVATSVFPGADTGAGVF